VPAATHLPPSSNATARCSVGGGVVRVGAASRPPSPYPPTPRWGRTARPASWPSDEAHNTNVGGCGTTAAVAPRRGQLLRRARAFAGRWPIHAPLVPPPGNVQRGRRGAAFQGAPKRGMFCCLSDGGAERGHEWKATLGSRLNGGGGRGVRLSPPPPPPPPPPPRRRHPQAAACATCGRHAVGGSEQSVAPPTGGRQPAPQPSPLPSILPVGESPQAPPRDSRPWRRSARGAGVGRGGGLRAYLGVR